MTGFRENGKNINFSRPLDGEGDDKIIVHSTDSAPIGCDCLIVKRITPVSLLGFIDALICLNILMGKKIEKQFNYHRVSGPWR